MKKERDCKHRDRDKERKRETIVMVLARRTGLAPAASMHDMLLDRDRERETNEERKRL